jgi:ELWxxDGT repeat protein
MNKINIILYSILISFVSTGIKAQVPILVNDETFVPEICHINQLIRFKGELYFEADQCDYQSQLYKSDGTQQGTGMLKEIVCDCSGWIGSDPENLIVINDQMFFSQFDSTNTVKELWVTDGTYEGTRIVKHFNTHNWQGMKYPIKFDNKLFFIIDTEEYGYELWKSDGSEAGTVLVKDINPGTEESFPWYLMIMNDELFFFADDGQHGSELWKTDGSGPGTVMVKDINPGSGSSANNIEESYINYSGHLLFSANDGIRGAELWKTDGTENGTTMIKDINAGEHSSRPGNFVIYNNIVYFTAADYSHDYASDQPSETFYNTEFYRTDGTEEGTYLIKDINNDMEFGSFIDHLTVCNNTLLFTATASPDFNGGELYKSDGTAEGTIIVKAFSEVFQSYSSYYLSTGSILFFAATDPEHGDELWKSNGSENTTSLVYDIEPGYGDSHPAWMTIVDSVLYFTTGLDCSRLWKLNGMTNIITQENNMPVMKVYPVPFTDCVHVECPDLIGKKGLIKIYDHLGRAVYQKTFDDSSDIFISGLDKIDAGIYFLEISINNYRATRKIVKINSK